MISDEIQFVAVQFFPLTFQTLPNYSHSLKTQEFQKGESEKDRNSDSEESTNTDIFIEASSETFRSINQNCLNNRSTLHNFQKHLFTFIQYLIPKVIEIEQVSAGRGRDCEIKILEMVKRQRKRTKEQLLPIFGSRIQKIKQNYWALIEEYSKETVKDSLMKVKRYLMDRINPQVLSEYIQRSKIAKKQEFKKYLQSFVLEVQEDRFTSRLTKTSQNIIKQFKTQSVQMDSWSDVIV